MSDAASELARILELARAQRPDPAGWSLVVDVDWLERIYFDLVALRMLQPLPTAELGGCAAVSASRTGTTREVTVTSMLRPGCEELWTAQLVWIEERIAETGGGAIRVVSECLTDAEKRRWATAGYDLVFEELAMERSLSDSTPAAAGWPQGTTILEWSPSTAEASFEVYQAAFADRPGFPGWSRSDWIERLTGAPGFMREASLCVLRGGVPAGFVVCSSGWIDQVGVAPSHRRLGLGSALVTEATARMRRLGIPIARLHVNTNNPEARAAWRHLGWRESGRRGRFERRAPSVLQP